MITLDYPLKGCEGRWDKAPQYIHLRVHKFFTRVKHTVRCSCCVNLCEFFQGETVCLCVCVCVCVVVFVCTSDCASMCVCVCIHYFFAYSFCVCVRHTLFVGISVVHSS